MDDGVFKDINEQLAMENRLYEPWLRLARRFVGADAPKGGWDKLLAATPAYYLDVEVLIVGVGLDREGGEHRRYDEVPMVVIARLDLRNYTQFWVVPLSCLLFRRFDGIDDAAHARCLARIRRVARCGRPEPRIRRQDLRRVV